MQPTRRQLIGGFALAVVAVPLRKLSGFTGQPQRAPGTTDPRRAALIAARAINTIQMLSYKETGGFVTLDEIRSPRISEMIHRKKPELLNALQLHSAEVIPGFRTTVEVGDERRTYTVFIIEDAVRDGRSFAYATDDSGLISEGTVGADGHAKPADSFVGRPTRKPETVSRFGGLSSLSLAITSFFLPTLHADGKCGACGQCFQGSAADCGSTCSVLCCNLGYQDCKWCCMSFETCDCPGETEAEG